LEKITKSDIAKKFKMNEGTAGVYLQGYRVANKVSFYSHKKLVFNHLANLSESELEEVTYIKLAKKLKINKNTASAYITKFKQLKSFYEKKSYVKLVFGYLDKNEQKRTALDVAGKYPFIKADLVSKYAFRWFWLHPEVEVGKGATGIARMKEWEEEELEFLRNHNYGSYCRVMIELGKTPKAKKGQTTMQYIEELKKTKSQDEIEAYTNKKAFMEVSYGSAFSLLEKVVAVNPEIDITKTKNVALELKRRINNLGKDRSASTVVGTAIFLANKKISQERASEIMKDFGKCNVGTLRNFRKLVKIEKHDILLDS